MGRVAVVLVVLCVVAGGGAWLATQPNASVQELQPSSAAVIKAEGEIFAAFKAAGVKAVLTRTPQPVRVYLSDLELTSLVDSRLEQSSAPLHNLVLLGSSDGTFHATTDADWNGLTLHVFATGTVTFGSDGSIHVHIGDASVGRLPVPGGLAESLIAQSQQAAAVTVPAGISNLALQPVDGGAALSATAAPSLASVFG